MNLVSGISYSELAMVLIPNPIQVIVNEETAHGTEEFLSKRLAAIKNQRSTGDLELEDLALVIGNCFVLIQLNVV